MRHLMLAATMLVVALIVTFGAASALQGVAEARNNSVQSDPFEVTEIAKPAMKPASASAQGHSIHVATSVEITE
jgi:hypothetical protein